MRLIELRSLFLYVQKSQTEDERTTKASTISKESPNDGLFDDEEEEDDLIRLVRRQKEAYSARVAAGRPSIRRTGATAAQNAAGASNSASNSGSAAAPPVASTSTSVKSLTPTERLYRKLIRKHIGKAARLRATIRREKINNARKFSLQIHKAFLKKNLPKSAKGPDRKFHFFSFTRFFAHRELFFSVQATVLANVQALLH